MLRGNPHSVLSWIDSVEFLHSHYAEADINPALDNIDYWLWINEGDLAALDRWWKVKYDEETELIKS